jgi:uncharacterized protein with PIN domain
MVRRLARDASAMLAIIAMEDDAAGLAARLGRACRVYISPVAVFETAAGLARNNWRSVR